MPGATTVLFTTSILSISGHGVTQGHGDRLRVERRQDTNGAQLLEFMCAVIGFLPVWTLSCCIKAAPLCTVLNYTHQTRETMNWLVRNGTETLKCVDTPLRDVTLFICGTFDFYSYQSHVDAFKKIGIGMFF